MCVDPLGKQRYNEKEKAINYFNLLAYAVEIRML